MDLVNDSLTELVYDADLAGLHYDVQLHPEGIFMSVSGYNDKLHVLAKRVLERVKNLEISAERLAVIKEQVGTQPLHSEAWILNWL